MLMKMVRKMMPIGDRALSGMRVRIADFPLGFVNRRLGPSPTSKIVGSFKIAQCFAMDDVKIEAIDKDQRTWAMIAHLSGFAMYFSGIGLILGPLVVWLLKRDGNPFVDDQGKEALNFSISCCIYFIGALVLCFTIIGLVIGIPVLFILPTLHIVFMIIAGIKANEGVAFRYPATIRFIT
jgi:uncharacterized Tic20 family protein